MCATSQRLLVFPAGSGQGPAAGWWLPGDACAGALAGVQNAFCRSVHIPQR